MTHVSCAHQNFERWAIAIADNALHTFNEQWLNRKKNLKMYIWSENN
jgi:hypothetical protein